MLVESEFFIFEDVVIGMVGLVGVGGDDGVEMIGFELFFESGVDFVIGGEVGSLFFFNRFGFFYFFNGLILFLLVFMVEGLVIVGFVLLMERSGIDLDDGGFG